MMKQQDRKKAGKRKAYTDQGLKKALEGGVRLHCIRAVAESEDGGE